MSKSEEYMLLKANRPDVKKVFASDIEWFAEELNDAKLDILNDSKYKEVTNKKSLLEEDDKASILWDALFNRVSYDRSALESFVDILKKRKAKFGELIGKLDKGTMAYI